MKATVRALEPAGDRGSGPLELEAVRTALDIGSSAPGTPLHPATSRRALIFSASIAICIAVFCLIRAIGGRLQAPAGTASANAVAHTGGGAQGDALLHLLVALVGITLAARILGRVFQMLGQPLVIGEIVAGILLGPSLLGRIWPDALDWLTAGPTMSFLDGWSQLGAILFMFLIGLHIDARRMREQARRTVAIAQAGMIVPFVLGSALALVLYPILSTRDVPFTSFMLFLGTSMSVTAFPVLARILSDRGVHATPLGTLALTCAAVGDLMAWCLLALVVSIVRAGSGGGLRALALALVFAVILAYVARPLMARLARRTEAAGRLTAGTVAAVLVAMLVSAAVTQAIGIHALIGSFALGVVVPHDSRLATAFVDRLQDVVVVLFLPVYFAVTGMRTQVGLLDTPQHWLLWALIVLVASAGKFGGVTAVARWTGLSWRTSAALGILMNTRGLMELIVLNIGYDLGLISPTLFAMLVLMAIATTIGTTPGFQALTRMKPIGSELERDKPSLSRFSR